jgi:hypothetical protein
MQQPAQQWHAVHEAGVIHASGFTWLPGGEEQQHPVWPAAVQQLHIAMCPPGPVTDGAKQGSKHIVGSNRHTRTRQKGSSSGFSHL